MKKLARTILTLAAMGALLGGCGGENATPAEIDAGDATAPVAAQVGQIVTLSLEENPSTGYTWQWESDAPEAIELAGDDFVQGGEEDMVGAPGVRTFKFKALAAGTANVTFTYGQDWDGGQQDPDLTKTLTLNITE